MEGKTITNIYADFEGLLADGKLPRLEDVSSLLNYLIDLA